MRSAWALRPIERTAALALETDATEATDAAETDARTTAAASAAASLDEIIDWTEATEAAETELTLSTDAEATLATELTDWRAVSSVQQWARDARRRIGHWRSRPPDSCRRERATGTAD